MEITEYSIENGRGVSRVNEEGDDPIKTEAEGEANVLKDSTVCKESGLSRRYSR